MGNIQTIKRPAYFVDHVSRLVLEVPVVVPEKLTLWGLIRMRSMMMTSFKSGLNCLKAHYLNNNIPKPDDLDYSVTMEWNETDYHKHLKVTHKSPEDINIESYIEKGYTKVVLA